MKKTCLLFAIIWGLVTTSNAQLNNTQVKTQNIEGIKSITLAGKLVSKISDDSTAASKSDKSLITEKAAKAYAALTQNLINVQTFGLIGNGTTDNTINLQNAINYASSNKKALFFPAGTYHTKQVILKSNLCIVGDGDQTIIKGLDISSGSYTIGSVFKTTTSVDNVVFKNLKIDGGATHFITSKEGAIISLFNSTNITFQGVKFINGLSAAITTERCQNLNVYDCYFNNFGWSAMITIGVKNAIFKNNQTYAWAKKDLDLNSAWAFPSNDCENVVLEINYFKNTSGAIQFALEMYGGWCKNWFITNNVFDANGYFASGISGAFKHSVIASNIFKNGSGSQRCGLEVHLDSSTVSNNIIDNGSIVCAVFTHVSSVVKNAKIIGNTITSRITSERLIMLGGGGKTKDTICNVDIMNNTIRAEKVNTNEAIYVGFYGIKCNTKNIIIKNNVIQINSNSTGVRVGGFNAQNILVDNNVIDGGYWGVFVDADAHNDVFVTNNKIDHVANISLPTAMGVFMSNNIVNGKLINAIEPAPKPTSPGTKGMIKYTATGIYICADTNTWVRGDGATTW